MEAPDEDESTQASSGGDAVPNNKTHKNPTGKAASFSTFGEIRLDGEFFQAQGTNGRSCVTCHAVEDGWSIRPDTVAAVFDETDGLDPLFSRLDADVNTLTDAQIDAMSVEDRRAKFSMLLQGKFTRNVTLGATRDFDLTAATDPFGISSVGSQRMWFFRRPLATANFKSATVMWDSANTQATGLRDGLIRQARGNVTGAQEGPPASDPVIFEMVDYERAISNAQLIVDGVGRLDSDGATGGPEAQASQPLVAGNFNLFDAWENDDNPRRAQIARGQALFVNGDHNGRQCDGCHNAQNSGQNVAGTLFNVGASRPEFARPDMAVFTFTSRVNGAVVQSTDGGRGIRSGKFADLNRFKVPSLRGLAARPPYFHNGIADTLEDVVKHYEAALGFDFSDEEEADLVAFLNAL